MMNDIKSLKKELQVGDIILCHGDSLISYLIQKVTNSYYNHVTMYVGNGLIIEADSNAVSKTSLRKYENKPIKVLRHKTAKPTDLEEIVNYAEDNFMGDDYDWGQIFELGWLYITGKRGTASKIGSDNKFICSELVAVSYIFKGYRISDRLPVEQISPADYQNSKYLKDIYITGGKYNGRTSNSMEI